MTKKKKTKQFLTRFSVPTYKKLRLFAFKKNISMSEVIEEAVKMYLKAGGKK